MAIKAKRPTKKFVGLFAFMLHHKLLDSFVQILYLHPVPCLDCVDKAVLDMILEYDFRGIVQRGAHCRQLYQNLGAISAVLNHLLYGFKMADGACEPVDNKLGLSVLVFMRVNRPIWSGIGVYVFFCRHLFHLMEILRK
jgi:hypothetical protein